jgi:hypothetical protein
MKSVPVLIAGGAPVGMTLACELSRRGIACMLVERNASTTRYPKMDITNARSMELLTKLSQLGQERLVLSGSFWDVEVSADKPDPKDLAGLLRARRKRPRERAAAKKRDEIAPPHVLPRERGPKMAYRGRGGL